MATRSRELEVVQDFAPDRAAQALLNLRCAVDHCHDAIFIADSNGKIEFVNAAFEPMTGYSAHEAMESGLALIIKREDRKSTRLNSSHLVISYAVFCLKKKKSRHPSSHLLD